MIEDADIYTPSEDDEWDNIVDLLNMAHSIVEAINKMGRESGAPIVADAEGRDDLFPDPEQGNRVWRNDLGYTETYYETYHETTNPGGKTAAGWARDGFQGGTLPIALGGSGANSKSGARINFGITAGYGDPSGGDDGDIYFKVVG